MRGLIAMACAATLVSACSTVEEMTDVVSFDGTTYAGDVSPSSRPQVTQSSGGSAQNGTAVALAPEDVVAGTPRAPRPAAPPPQNRVQQAPPPPSASSSVPPSRGPSQPVNSSSGSVAFPNLADVPEPPEDLPSDDEIADVREGLEDDRDAAGQNADDAGSQSAGSSSGGGSTLQELRSLLEQSSTASSSSSRLVTIAYAAGETAVPGGATGDVSSVAGGVGDGNAVRIVGYALVDDSTDRAAALGVALQRANAIAAALVNQGVDPGSISVFGNAVTASQAGDVNRARRVDIFIE